MCVILSILANRKPSKDILKNCYDNNPDGWGIMAAVDGKLEIERGLDFANFTRIWKTFPKNVNRAIHFRWRTHGEINTENCHPFNLSRDVAMMHNGILSVPMDTPKMSDTWHFARSLRPWIANIPRPLEWEDITTELENCTHGSRLLLMDNTGQVKVTYRANWHEEGGILYSNSHSHRKQAAQHGKHAWEYEDDYNHKSPKKLPKHVNWENHIALDFGDLVDLCESDPEGAAHLIMRLNY